MKRIFAHIGFAFALTMLVLNCLPKEMIPIVAVGLAVLLLASLLLRYFREAVSVPLCLGAAVLACLVFWCVYQASVVPILALNGKTAAIQFYITDLPVFNGSSYQYTVRAKEVLLPGAPQNILLHVSSATPITAEPYTLTEGNVTFYSIGDTARTSYHYWNRSIYIGARLNDFNVTDTVIPSPMKAVLWLRNDIIETLVRTVKGDAGAIAAAMITGDKYYVTDEVRSLFRYAGVSHLMAVSGLHLSVVTGVVYFVFKKLLSQRRAASAVTVVVTVAYMALAGFSSSIVRAGIMVLTLHIAVLVGKRADTLNSLGLAVFLLCLNPFAVLDAGAVLSVLSVLAILASNPYHAKIKAAIMKHKKHSNPVSKAAFRLLAYVAGSLVMTGAILLFTLPAMAVFFDYVTFAALLANIILIPLGSLATVLAFVTYLCIKLHLISVWMISACRLVFGILLSVVRRIGALDALTVSTNTLMLLAAAGGMILFAFCFIKNNQQLLKTAAVLSVIALIATMGYSAYERHTSTRVLITEHGAVLVMNQDRADVYNLTAFEDYYAMKQMVLSDRLHIRTLYDTSKGASKRMIQTFSAEEIIPMSSIDGIFFGETEIHIVDGYAVDAYGSIDLSKGAVLYTVQRDGTYQVRRVENG